MSIAEKTKWGKKYRGKLQNKIPPKIHNEWLEKWSTFPDNARILDLASGLGTNALYMASQRNNVVAIDIAEEALFALKRNALSKDLNLDLVVADLDCFFPCCSQPTNKAKPNTKHKKYLMYLYIFPS